MPLYLETPFFTIYLSFWQWLFALPSGEFVRVVIGVGGWTVLALIFFSMGLQLWTLYRQNLANKKWQWALLAVDIPPLLIQSPKAVEQIFAHFSGALLMPNIGEKFWNGKKQKWFSLEIISIEGYIQFLIRTEAEFRDLMEAAIYAQYPEAEITEVEDYVEAVPARYPNSEYEMMGLEFKLADKDAYPIRTYQNFEYSLSKDVVFSDPMAAILENFSRLGRGEQLWFQIILEPTDSRWKEKGIELVKKIVSGDDKFGGGEGILSKFAGLPRALAKMIIDVWDWNFEPSEKEAEPSKKVSDLTPGLKSTVEAVEDKISKIGFKCKIRTLYVARKESYNPDKCLGGIVGSLNQFNLLNRNGLVPSAKTSAPYAFKTSRTNFKKNVFMTAYKKRKIKTGANPYVMNIEEMATIWHFPLPFVKTPLVQKTATKRGEPPIGLPVESTEASLRPLSGVDQKRESQPLDNLPFA
ncbi:MAG: hypothetical protein UX39_C0012G0015 [Candidatus Magasanikbacteria bacterium GW2011_GWA2_46_17]|uniref:DUF8128 domain-containing protein n=1 Tax=Candidatus Magasanikbacteria bacterium GW2011_GWA2_46_17 TaxID=1619042 RepID=A0A0G1R7Y9_9BACT|nr:MAG: hypothetical protein UX39_C0012G0015 [Candidatus Magasanikbacteria bacterium GW2011_GWA2_46_17]